MIASFPIKAIFLKVKKIYEKVKQNTYENNVWQGKV